MRGPEEAMNAKAQSSSSREEESGLKEGRDPCSSPPSKRLKQAVLSFQSNTSTSPLPSSPSPPKVSNGIPKEVIVIDDGNRAPNCGGLVTAAPSPPEKGHLKPQSMEHTTTKDQKDDEKQPDISNDTLNDSPKSDDKGVISSPKQTSPNNAKTPLKPTSAEKKKCKEELQRMKEERQKLKEEKERQRLEAKAQKEKEKQEAKQKKEQERLEKQAEKEKKEKERLEKKQREEKEKQEKKEKKEEERRKKEEEVHAKLEEKRKKEEEKKQQEEELQRKRKQASLSFKNFFTKTTNAPPKTLPKSVLKFEPFEIKPYMSLAPVVRKQLSKESEQTLDKLMLEQEEGSLYMKELQKRKPLPPYRKERRRTISQSKSSNQKEPTEKIEKKDQNESVEISDDDSDSESVVEIQQEEKKRMKVIFLKFHENNRPPYYGTHRKRSKKISPKNPLNKDEGLLNYEIDSDDEWEEEEPGESLSDCSDAEDDEADDGGEEEDDGFMVPHGYLSDDEGIDADDEENEVDSTSKQEQQLAKAKAWEAELKRKCKAKKPVCIGCVWPDNKNMNEMLQQFEACILVDVPSIAIHTTNSSTSVDSSQSMNEITSATPDSVYKGGMYVPEEAMQDLITLIHRSSAGVVKLMNYFKQHWSKKCENTKAHPSLAGKGHISKRQLEAKIKAIATKERRDDKSRWYVHGNILAAYGLTRLATKDNEQGAMIGKSCSPQMSNTGIKVFTKCVSPTANPGQNTVLPMVTSPHLQTGNISSQEKQQSVGIPQVLQAEVEQSCVTPAAKRRVILQPSNGELGAVESQPNPQGSSVGHGSQEKDQQPLVIPVPKRRVALQPVSKVEVGSVVAEEKQGSAVDHGSQEKDQQSLVTPVMKRRVALQPVSKAEVGDVIAKENQPNHQVHTASIQYDKPPSVVPVAKRRAVLQPIAKPDIGGINAKEMQPIPTPSGVEPTNSCTESSINTSTVPIKNQEQGITNINPSDGLMKGSSVTITTHSPNTSPSNTGCLSPAVKRMAPSPVGTDRMAKVPRKSETAMGVHHHVNKPVAMETAESVEEVTNRPLAQDALDFIQRSTEPQESSKNLTSETAKLENSGKEITECMLNVCKTDGVQPMEIEQIIKA